MEKQKVVLFQGDSITDCGRVREDLNSLGIGYPNMIKGYLGVKYPEEFVFINKGISGDRIVDVYARIKRDIINLKPDYMSILIGVNDVWHELDGVYNGISAEKFEMLYDLLISEVLEELPYVKIMIIAPFVLEVEGTTSLKSDPLRWSFFKEEVALRAEAAKRVAEKYHLSFVELQNVWNKRCNLAPASYWLCDGVHPTAMGHWIIMEAWSKAFEIMLERK